MTGKRGGYSLDLKHRIRLRVSDTTYEQLTHISNKTGLNLSKVARHCLEDRLESLMEKGNSPTESTPDTVG